jgi:molecular chaperone GrpE
MAVFAMNSSETQDTQDNPLPEPQGANPSVADQLAAAKKEAAENHDRYLRTAADLENFRRRTVRDKEELRLFASSRLLEDLLPALDNLALGVASAQLPNADLKTLANGVDLVQQQLKSALAAHGLKEINPLGQAFDPHQHEAISHEPSPNVAAEHILKVVRPGYVLNGRLLRPASVVISSGKAAKEAGG